MEIIIGTALFLLLTGLSQILFPDAMWRLHAWGKRAEGVRAERTPEWDRMRAWTSVLMILLASALLIYGCSWKGGLAERPPPDIGRFEPEDLPPNVAAILTAEVMQSNERTAIDSLRRIVSFQAMFRHAVRVDSDADGEGEFGGLLEMAGLAKGRMDSKHPLPDFPPFLLDREGGTATRAGYCYRVYLPDGRGVGVAEPAAGFTAGMVNATLCEQAWCCYAWPIVRGRSGTRTFFTNQEGDVLATDASAYSGPSRGPPADAAFRGPMIVRAASQADPFVDPDQLPVTGRTPPRARGQDGNVWMRVDR